MPIVSALLMGTGMGVCVFGTSLIGLARSNRKQEMAMAILKFEERALVGRGLPLC